MVFQSGISRAPNSIVSTTSRIEGSGGKMYSFCAMNSLRMSFCSVPASCLRGTPCFSAATMYIAQMGAAGELIVIDVVISPIGSPSSSTSISASDVTLTPHRPNSPAAAGSSMSQPMSVGRSKAMESPVWPCVSRYLKRSFVSSALPKPANMRIVQRRPR